MNCFRLWCKRNSPVIDFFSKIIFGLSSVIIAFYAVNISTGQLSIQKSQIEIQRQQAQAQMQQHLPSIVVRYSVQRNSNPRLDDLIISNEGADLFNPEFDVIAFLNPRELEIVRPDSKIIANSKLQSAKIPVINFFRNVSYASSEAKGELYRVTSKDQSVWEKTIEQFERSHVTDSKSMTSNFQIFVSAKYVDKFRKPHIEYFEVSSMGELPIDNAKGEELFKSYNDAIKFRKILNLDTPNFKEVQNLWNENKH